MSVISSPKSLATRGRLINIEGGSELQPAINLEAKTHGILVAKNEGKIRDVISITDARKIIPQTRTAEVRTQKLEMRHVG